MALAALLGLTLLSPARAQTTPIPSARGPVAVLLLTPDFEYRQLGKNSCPGLARLAAAGSVGIMNVRTVHSGSLDEGFLTIGAGNRAVVSFAGEIGQSFNRTEHFEGAAATDVYSRRTNLDPQRFGLLAMDYAQIKADSKTVSYDLVPGLLGDTLKSAHIRSAALGNADVPAGPDGMLKIFHREVLGVTMDHLGRGASGDVSISLQQGDSESPFSRHVNVPKILDRLRGLERSCGFIAIEDGDLLALHASSEVYTGAAFHAQTRSAIRRLDSLIIGIESQLDFRRDLLIVCTPVVEPGPMGVPMLAPILAAGPGLGGGWLSSSSTRRAGLVVNTDLAPTILSFFGIVPPLTMPGSAIRSAAAVRRWGAGPLWNPGDRNDPITGITGLEKRIDEFDSQRNDVERWFVYLIQAMLLISAGAILLGDWRPARRTGLRRWGPLVPPSIPLAMLIAPFFRPSSSLVAALLVVVLTVALTWIAHRMEGFRPGHGVALLAWASMLAILLDLVTGQQGMISSMISYSPSEGARYYGIGNEYMGVLIGASISALAISASRSHVRRSVAAAVLFVPATMIALPSVGAKAGGALVAVPAAAIAAWALVGGRMRARALLIVFVLGVFALAGIALWDLHRGNAASHVGKAMGAVLAGGGREILNVIGRKSSMEWRLLKYSPWSRVLIFALLTMAVIRVCRKAEWQAMVNQPLGRCLVWGILTATVTGLLFNDAGVLAAALSLIWLPAGTAMLTAPRRPPTSEPSYESVNGDDGFE